MKQFFLVLFIGIFVFAGCWTYNQFSGQLNQFIGIDNTPPVVASYSLNVNANNGTAIDYVDYDIISVEDYSIETDGFDRQFVELSVYNLSTDTQLENNSAIEIGDELNIHIAVPDGYRLISFFVGGYYATNDYLYTVNGNTSIFVEIERIVVNFSVKFERASSTDYDIDCGLIDLEINGINIYSGHAGTDYLENENWTMLEPLFYGDEITITYTPTEFGEIAYIYICGYMLPPDSDNINGVEEVLIYEYTSEYDDPSDLINPYTFSLGNVYSVFVSIFLTAI